MEQVNIEGEKDNSEHKRMISMAVNSDSVSLSHPNWIMSRLLTFKELKIISS
jgi:hypothetical protein